MKKYNMLKPLHRNRKGIAGLGTLETLVISVVTISVVIALGLVMLVEFQGQLDTGDYAANATGELITALSDIPTWVPIIILVVIIVVLLGLVTGLRGATRQ